MSSATQYNPNAGRKVISTAVGQFMDRNSRLGMTPRQQRLNQLYSHYRCCQYDARQYDWDGSKRMDPVDREAIATATFLPPGFVDKGGNTWPLKFRKPSAPYNLVKVIVDRFTGLLFSERRHPQPRAEGDEATEDFIQALAEAGRLWPAMIQARGYGGSMGSVAVGFQFIHGRPHVEAHDPRWVTPTWVDRATLELERIDKRYIFHQEVFDDEKQQMAELPFWYRRIIDRERDVLWKPILVADGVEPNWLDEENIERIAEHGFGFCPVVWIQNMPMADDIDGDPDCQGIYDEVESIDSLTAQAQRGILANCDPTLVVVSPDRLDGITKGNENAIKLTQGSAQYLEAGMTGPKQALEMADILRNHALEVAQCVLEHPDTAQKTATEIERSYSSMLSKADVLREQYGERGVKPLLEMMVKAARKVTTAVAGVDDSGQPALLRGSIELPERVSKRSDGTMEKSARKLGSGGVIKLQWPGYFEPAIGDASQAVQAASSAKLGGLIDKEHAAKFVAEYFRVEDVPSMLATIKSEAQEQQGNYAADMLGDLQGGAPQQPSPEYASPDEYAEPEAEYAPESEAQEQRGPEQSKPMTKIELTSTDLAIIVTVNEARMSNGLPALPGDDGNLTISEFKAKHSSTVATAVNAEAGEGEPNE